MTGTQLIFLLFRLSSAEVIFPMTSSLHLWKSPSIFLTMSSLYFPIFFCSEIGKKPAFLTRLNSASILRNDLFQSISRGDNCSTNIYFSTLEKNKFPASSANMTSSYDRESIISEMGILSTNLSTKTRWFFSLLRWVCFYSLKMMIICWFRLYITFSIRPIWCYIKKCQHGALAKKRFQGPSKRLFKKFVELVVFQTVFPDNILTPNAQTDGRTFSHTVKQKKSFVCVLLFKENWKSENLPASMPIFGWYCNSVLRAWRYKIKDIKPDFLLLCLKQCWNVNVISQERKLKEMLCVFER